MTWIRQHNRFAGFLLILLLVTAVFALLPVEQHIGSPLLVGFDVAAVIYLGYTLPAFSKLGPVQLRQRAIDNGDNVHTLVVIGAIVVMVVMIALASELIDKRPSSVIISAFTLCLAWIFINGLFLLYYAHVYYIEIDGADAGGIEFAGDNGPPDAWDMAYFAYTMAIIFSVSDVVITSRRVRRIVMLHGILAFTFNIFAIGVSIGLISNLFA